MIHALTNLSIHARFLIAEAALTFAWCMAMLGVRLLPRRHPSRTYIIGRMTEGRDRLRLAIRAPRHGDVTDASGS